MGKKLRGRPGGKTYLYKPGLFICNADVHGEKNPNGLVWQYVREGGQVKKWVGYDDFPTIGKRAQRCPKCRGENLRRVDL